MYSRLVLWLYAAAWASLFEDKQASSKRIRITLPYKTYALLQGCHWTIPHSQSLKGFVTTRDGVRIIMGQAPNLSEKKQALERGQ